MRCRCTPWRVIVLAVGLSTAGGAGLAAEQSGAGGPPGQSAPQSGRAGAWDRSVALEAANDFLQAKAILVDAYGQEPESYDVTLRLGWLSLRLKQASEAIAWYRRARGMPDATPDATLGLASAITLRGYQSLNRGDLPAARRDFQEALRLDRGSADARRGLDLVGPSTGAAPEVWYGHLGEHASSDSASAFFVQVPYRASDRVSIRGAYRRIGAASSATTGESSTTTPFFGNQDEVYGSVSYERGMTETEVMGFVVHNALQTVPGGAARLRIGGRVGLTATVSGMSASDGGNTQLLAQGFVWATPWLAAAGGARLTSAPSGSSTSAVVGATLRGGPLQVDVEGHVGTEVWAFSMAAPMIMSFAGSTDAGLTATATVRLTRQVSLCGQFQVERLPAASSASQGRYTGVAAGIRWFPGRGKETIR